MKLSLLASAVLIGVSGGLADHGHVLAAVLVAMVASAASFAAGMLLGAELAWHRGEHEA